MSAEYEIVEYTKKNGQKGFKAVFEDASVRYVIKCTKCQMWLYFEHPGVKGERPFDLETNQLHDCPNYKKEQDDTPAPKKGASSPSSAPPPSAKPAPTSAPTTRSTPSTPADALSTFAQEMYKDMDTLKTDIQQIKGFMGKLAKKFLEEGAQ